ncbi:MAG TPA: DUF1501 domain-containing protein [Acidimicrobiales bacterium]
MPTGTGLSRRDFLKRGAMAAAVPTLWPLIGRVGPAFGLDDPDPSTALRNRLVVIFLSGGNDGLNTVIPMWDADGTQRRSVYQAARPTLQYADTAVLHLDLTTDDAAHGLGLHPSLTKLHAMYEAGRVAVVQGVDYPNHSYSHFESTDIWQSGQPLAAPDSGWLGRHLDRSGIGAGELRAAAMTYDLPLALRGTDKLGITIPTLPFRFSDGTAAAADAKHAAAKLYANHPSSEPLRQYWGERMDESVRIVETLEVAPATPNTGNGLANALLTARTLLEGNYGTEVVFVAVGGYDTHELQRTAHQTLLTNLDNAIDTFFNGVPASGIPPLSPTVADRTMVMTFSEFGRRLKENGSAGTDHGAAAPLFLVGPPAGRLVGGIHGDHPNVGTTLAPVDNILQTTDLRAVYQAVLEQWLADPDPTLGAALPGLFLP